MTRHVVRRDIGATGAQRDIARTMFQLPLTTLRFRFFSSSTVSLPRCAIGSAPIRSFSFLSYSRA